MKRITKRIQVGVVGSRNSKIGELHHRSVLSDQEVELIRSIYDEGLLKYEDIGIAFGVAKSTVSDIVNFRRRACTPDRYKTVEVEILDGRIVSYKDITEN